jgi:hypothetical protein
MSRSSLSNILNEDTEVQAEIRPSLPEASEPETGVEPEPEEKPEPSAEPPSALPKEVYEPLRAVRDENKALKDQLEQLRREVTAKPKEPEAPPPTIWEDEQAALAYTQQQAVAQSLAGSAYQTKLFTSEFHARKNIDGFETDWEPLNQWLGQNPSVAQQAAADYDPWGFAFRAYKNQQTMQELGAMDVEQLKAKIRADLEAEMAASRPPVIPPSLSSQRSVGSRSGPAWSGAKPLKDLLA